LLNEKPLRRKQAPRRKTRKVKREKNFVAIIIIDIPSENFNTYFLEGYLE
jgi:hypothetical protein